MPLACPHCLKADLVALGGQDDNITYEFLPELLLPFTVATESLNQNIQHFAGDIWFAPGDLNPKNLRTRLQRIYLPMWLVDRQVQATWQAETGFNYDAISHRDSFDDKRGGWHSEQLTETRIRWEPRVGRLSRTYDNIPAPALEEHFALMRQLGQYALNAHQPYQSQAIDRSLVRLPDRSPTDAWPDAVPALQTAAAHECQHAAGADHIREFRWAPDYQDQNWTLLLLPMYASYYLDDDQNPQTVLIHGQTGKLSGPRRASMKRAQRMAVVIIAIAAIIFTLSILVAIASFFFPPLFFLAGLGVVVAIIVGLLAIAPIVIAWQFNRTNK